MDGLLDVRNGRAGSTRRGLDADRILLSRSSSQVTDTPSAQAGRRLNANPHAFE
jgi:hypothetical protein